MVHIVIVGDLACAIARPRRKGARANERRASKRDGGGKGGGEHRTTDR